MTRTEQRERDALDTAWRLGVVTTAGRRVLLQRMASDGLLRKVARDLYRITEAGRHRLREQARDPRAHEYR